MKKQRNFTPMEFINYYPNEQVKKEVNKRAKDPDTVLSSRTSVLVNAGYKVSWSSDPENSTLILTVMDKHNNPENASTAVVFRHSDPDKLILLAIFVVLEELSGNNWADYNDATKVSW